MQRINQHLRTMALLLPMIAHLLLSGAAGAQSVAPATVINDEGGPVAITGKVTYTNAFFTLGVSAPMVILEDEAGFVDRNEHFLLPLASQTLGQITSDFYESPFSYSIALPIEPQGSLRDVDQNGAANTGVMIFAVAYWQNTFGDPFLEERDLYGGGWSTAYASTRVSDDPATIREITGGKFLVYAPDAEQGFPSGFGNDKLLFTADDPIVLLPQGYTIVDMDQTPFVFDRSRHPVVDLVEPKSSALDDFSQLSYTQAFDAMLEKLRKEYAFTDYKKIDWDALDAEFRPLFAKAEADGSEISYLRALRDFSWRIPDGHVKGPIIAEDFQRAVQGGIGLSIIATDDGRIIVSYLAPDGPAAVAGIELGAEIIAINDMPIQEFVEKTIVYAAPFSTEHVAWLQKLRYATRSPLGAEFRIDYRNPNVAKPTSVTLRAVGERASFEHSSFNVGRSRFDLPIEYSQMQDSDYVYVRIRSFSDNSLLTVQLWERMIRSLRQQNSPGLIIDLRQNSGGSGFLADQMAAYFYNEPLELGNTGSYNEETGKFEFDPRTVDRFYLPDESLRYSGKVAILVGPNCNSACEFFAYDMTQQDRSAIVGQYPTAGLGGSVSQFKMPSNEFFQFTSGRAVDMQGNIHIEGKGVEPTVRVPVNEQTLFGETDAVLNMAIDWLDGKEPTTIRQSGSLAVGSLVEGQIKKGQRVQYTLDVTNGETLSIYLEGEDPSLDTVLRLYDAQRELLLENDNANTSVLSSAIIDLDVPMDLTMIVEVSTKDDAQSGFYTLHVEAQ